MSTPKSFKVIKTVSSGKTYEFEGTVEDLIQTFLYTLDTGRSYQHEKGNKKINMKPKSITSLISNLNNAVNNSAANGYAGVSFSSVQL